MKLTGPRFARSRQLILVALGSGFADGRSVHHYRRVESSRGDLRRPVLVAAGTAQFLLFRKAGLAPWTIWASLLIAALINLSLTWVLMWEVPPTPLVDYAGYGGVVFVPAFLAAAVITGLVAIYVRVRRPRTPLPNKR
jgi:fatty acid desaturase